MQENYTKQTQRVIEEAKKAAYELDHSYIGTEHILTGLVCVDGCVSSVVLSNYGVSREKIEEFMDQLIAPMSPIGMREPEGFTPSAKKLLETSEKEAKRFQMPRIGTEHILLAILKETDSMAYRLLGIMGVNTQKLCVDTLIAMGEDPNRYKEYFQNGKPMKHKGKGKASMIEQYSKDLTKAADKQELDPVIGREEEIQRLIQILSRRTKNNPCLVGEPGVGKTAIVEGLAQRITMGNVPITLEKKRVLTLDLSGMVAGSKYRGEFEERIKRIVEEVKKDGNIILFIDEIHTIIGAGGAEGAIDASNILKPSLARGELQIIGATTQEEYRKYFERDAALERRFQPVTVEEATVEETVEILRGLKEKYEQHHSVKITEAAILAAAKLSNRYISERFLPDKAIDLMDEAASKTRLSSFVLPPDIQKLTDEIQKMEQQKEAAIIAEEFERAGEIKKKQEKKVEKLKKIQEKWEVEKTSKKLKIGEAEIAEVVTKWTKIPVQKMEKEESLRMQNLESILQKRVVGQEEAVHAVSKAIRRGRVGLKDPKRPIGSFLFLGPTGVGKTELSKALSEAVFGSEKAMIRVDMSEYMEKHSVSRLIGTPPGYVGYEEGGQLSEKVRKNPYSVILFDEIEKAHPDVFNILLQVLDDGRITDGHGRVVDFKNTVLIMTSNAGASRIIEPKKLGFAAGESEAQDYESMKRNVMEEVKKMFKPEFLNRIDDTIVFHSLTKADMRSIVTILIHDLVDRANNQVHIKLEVTNPAKDFIAQESYDKKYGARPLKRAIQDKVEDTLAEEILKGSVKAGDTMVVSVSDKKLKFTVKK